MKMVLALILSGTLFASTLDSQAFAQNPLPSEVRIEDFKPSSAHTTVTTPQKTMFMWECDADQCEKGAGGAIWVFQGSHGQAVWHYGAVADLTIRSFDHGAIVVHRVDPIDSYSTQYTGGRQFFADYSGEVDGGNINGGAFIVAGTLHDKWKGGVIEGLCDGEQCPLDPYQLVELGENSLQAKLYTAAFLSFKAAARRGDYDGEAYAAMMLLDGNPELQSDPTSALQMLEDSAMHDSLTGERGLAQMYRAGIAVPKDPRWAKLWDDKADRREKEIATVIQKARQIEINKRTKMYVGLTVLAVLFLGAVAAKGLSSDEEDGPAAVENYALRFAQQQQGLQENCREGSVGACVWLGMLAPAGAPH